MTGGVAGSTLRPTPRGADLELATAPGLGPQGLVDQPHFFSGLVAHPQVVAAGLLVVADIAATSFFDLAAVRRAARDPVVTASGDRLRFESFSACNGVYARFDLLEDGIDSGDVGFGTTNVDLNDGLRTQLAGLGATDLLHLAVGRDLTVSTPEQTQVERQVELPSRWVRGFAQFPGIAAGMAPALELTGAQATRFLAGLPRGATGPATHLRPAADGPRGTTAEQCVVHLAGPGRLGPARRAMRFLTGVTAYRHDSGASGWVLHLPGAWVTLLLTAEASRGFSGEGEVLGRAQAAAEGDERLLLEQLAWQPVIDLDALAVELDRDRDWVQAAVARLGLAGRVGFDLTEQAWFHRDLPVDEHAASGRLDRARTLAPAVRRDGDGWQVGRHRVGRPGDSCEEWGCTCPWTVRRGSGRGPCAHVLAVQLAERGAETADATPDPR